MSVTPTPVSRLLPNMTPGIAEPQFPQVQVWMSTFIFSWCSWAQAHHTGSLLSKRQVPSWPVLWCLRRSPGQQALWNLLGRLGYGVPASRQHLLHSSSFSSSLCLGSFLAFSALHSSTSYLLVSSHSLNLSDNYDGFFVLVIISDIYLCSLIWFVFSHWFYLFFTFSAIPTLRAVIPWLVHSGVASIFVMGEWKCSLSGCCG
jgi:hypothetical protein